MIWPRKTKKVFKISEGYFKNVIGSECTTNYIHKYFETQKEAHSTYTYIYVLMLQLSF